MQNKDYFYGDSVFINKEIELNDFHSALSIPGIDTSIIKIIAISGDAAKIANDDLLKKITKICGSSLTTLYLKSCINVSDEGIGGLFGLESIKTIDINGSPNITGRAVTKIEKRIKSFESYILERGVPKKGLENLSLQNCGITPEITYLMATLRGSTLKTLNLSSNENIKQCHLQGLKNTCPNVEITGNKGKVAAQEQSLII